jgi:hypothetical protein
MKRKVVTLLTAAFWPLTFWIAGTDLMQRGNDVAICFMVAVGSTVLMWICPVWDKVRA